MSLNAWGNPDFLQLETFQVVTEPVIRINRQTSYCLAADILRSGRPDVRLMSDIKIRLNGESVSVQRGNVLLVTDRPLSGARIDQSLDQKLIELPYFPGEVVIAVPRTLADICFQSSDEGRLKNIEITYRLAQGSPIFPPPVIGPPQPPPPPQPVSEMRGQLVRASEEGVITGWACDLRSSRNTDVVLFVNGRREDIETADQSMHFSSSEMGSPMSHGCDSNSGFRFRIHPESYAGRTVDLEVRAISPITNLETSLGSNRLSFPLLEIDKGIFSVGRDIFFSDGISSGTYCHISTMDQVRIIGKHGYRSQAVNSHPSRMHNRGVCELWKIPEGLFMQTGSSPHIYYSNGIDAFCRLTTMDQVHGRPYPRLVDELPSHLRNDGDCQAP